MRQPLPQMQGEPMPIITDPNVKPVAVHRPVPVPLHWKEDLDQDVHLGIIKPVPINNQQAGGVATWFLSPNPRGSDAERWILKLSMTCKSVTQSLHLLWLQKFQTAQ